MLKRRLAGWLAAGTLIAALGAACGKTPEAPLSRSGFFLDTAVTLSLYHARDAAVLDAAFQRISTWEALFSRTLEGSDVWNINRAAGQAAAVSPDTLALIRIALSFAEKTDGALDITIAPVSTLWDFTAESPRPPDAQALREAAAHVNWRGVLCKENTVQLADPAMALDLGAVAKGYIADRLAAWLREQGVTSALLDLGGNIYALGGKDGGDFTVGIRDPADRGRLAATVRVRDTSVVTSGIYERNFTLDGTLYHHILDPSTGLPVDNGLASVTILSEQSVYGDALSTACFVLGEEKGMALIESLPDTEALFICRDGVQKRSSGFPEDK